MDELSKPEPRPRASLRGKGREILLGEQAESVQPSKVTPVSAQPVPLPELPGHVDPAALKLTPDETETLLDFSPDSPAYAASFPLEPAASSAPSARSDPASGPEVAPDDVLANWMRDETGSDEALHREVPSVPATPGSIVPEDWAVKPGTPWAEDERFEEAADTLTWPADARREPEEHETLAAPSGEGPTENAKAVIGDALPLAEREPIPRRAQEDEFYQAHSDVEALIPQEPEHWQGPLPLESEEPVHEPAAKDQAPAAEKGAGGSSAAEAEPESVLVDPFLADNKEVKRPSARTLFDDTKRTDRGLLGLLVDDDRIRRLSQQIEALQEDLALNVYGDRRTADTYQKELLQASGLLMSSRENYDDARAIVYRIRADMNRQRKVESDIRRYRPLLLNYYIGWGIALIVMFLLKALFTGVTEAVGVEAASALYYPMLLGIGGALVSGYMTLERHTTRLRDFDPLHISWYLFNPLLGGVMGLLMFLLASIANDDLLRGTANDAENAITYLLCVVAGMNQNSVLRQLNDLLKRFNKGNGS